MSHEVFNENNEPLEIERKFLIKDLPNLGVYEKLEILQGYLPTAEDGRIRKSNNQYFRTIKRGEGVARVEIESEITKKTFDELWPQTDGKRLEKTRYLISYGENIIEVDEYHGDLEGLFTAEVEFSSVETSDKFVPPEWFGEDVTENSVYSNYHLSTRGLPKV